MPRSSFYHCYRRHLDYDYDGQANQPSADVYHGGAREIITARNLVKEQTMRRRRRYNLGLRPLSQEIMRPEVYRECVHYQKANIVPKDLTTYN